MTRPQTSRSVITLFLGVIVSVLNPEAFAESSRIYSYTTQGAVPVDLNKGRLPKNSYETYYLESAIPKPSRPAATPKPKATPMPKATPKPKATPRPKATPKPKAQPTPQLTSTPKPAAITVTKKSSPAPVAKPPKSSPKPAAPPLDDLDEYGDTVKIADPIEPANRGMFWLNHQLYTYIARPISKVYRTILPKPVRTAVHNVYDNAEYPVRVVNHLLQGKPGRADLETRKFLLNSTAGVGGIFKPSDRFPSLAEVPDADTGQTFAKWGIGHGAYVVLPMIGPRSVRDTVGLAGDVALNPLTWVPIGGVAQAISIPLSTPNTVRNVDSRLNAYDAATENAVDPYISLRGSYIQYRQKAASK